MITAEDIDRLTIQEIKETLNYSFLKEVEASNNIKYKPKQSIIKKIINYFKREGK
jgi:hypothetical protein